MSKFLVTILIFVISITTQAQKNKSVESPATIDKAVYKNALQYNDYTTAIHAAHQIMALEGSTSKYKDTLTILYFRTKNYVSSYLLSKEILETKPSNLQYLEINAISLQNLGANKEAVAVFEKLFASSNNQFHGYELAKLQLGLKRLAEAQSTIEKVLLCEELKDVKIAFPIDNTNSQNVSLKAAAYNLKGLIAYELKETELATKAFEEALALEPEFVLAKQNKEALLKEKTLNK